MLILDSIRSTLLASFVLGFVPLAWWGIRGRKKNTFFVYFGLTRPVSNGRAAKAIATYCMVWTITHLPIFTQYTQPSATVYQGLGFAAMVPIGIISFLQTGFIEEFLFRGFINKRLVCRFGTKMGITLQAIVFGGLHLLISTDATLLPSAIIFSTTAIGGFMLGYIAETSYQGSILPGVLLHGAGNFIINSIQAFS